MSMISNGQGPCFKTISMKLKNVAKWGMMLCLSVCLSQCTLEEETYALQDLKLSHTTISGGICYQFEYDNQGRTTYVSCGDGENYEATVGISYDPMEITETEYDDDGEKSDVTVYTNIKLNSDGYITSASCTDYSYTDLIDDVTSQKIGTYVYLTEQYSCTCTYDSEGHITRITTSGEEPTIFQWENGNLISADDGETKVTCTYLSTPNTRNQWIPGQRISYDPLTIIGLLGKAPANLIESDSETDYGYGLTNHTYAYQINKSGYVEKVKFKEDGIVGVMSCYYTNNK